MWITGKRDGNPCKVGVAITDVLTGVYASGAITSALLWRERSGKGQFLDISLLDVIEAVDGPLTAHYPVGDGLPAESQARLREALTQITAQCRRQLDAIKLSSLLRPVASSQSK